jgi:hypothetical protein
MINARKLITDIELIVVGVSLLSISGIFWITRFNTAYPTSLWWIYLRDGLSTIAGTLSLFVGMMDMLKNKKSIIKDAV